MNVQILNTAHYAFASQAVPLYFMALVVAFFGALFAIRERGARVAAPFTLLTACGSIWLLSAGVALSALDGSVAATWLRIACAALVVLPIAQLWLTHSVLAPATVPLPGRHLFVVAGAALLWLALGTDLLVRSGDAVWSGADASMGFAGSAFAMLFAGAMLESARRLWRHRRQADIQQRGRRRVVLLAGCSLLGACIAPAFVHAAGAPLEFGSYWLAGGFFSLLAFVTWRYRPADITPAFVGAQISDIMTDALLVLDRGGVVRLANPAARRLLERHADGLLDRHAGELLNSTEFSAQIEALLAGHEVRDVETTIVAGTGAILTVSVSASAVRDVDATPGAFLFILRDISSRKQAERRIRELAYVDDLTQLPNRADFHRRLHDSLRGDGAKAQPLALLFLDLDRFKRINDTLGHDAGDQLLAIVAERLQHGLRGHTDRRDGGHGGSFIARLGGDEFVICLRGVDCRDALGSVARRILRALSDPFDLGGQEVFVTTSVGISRYPHDGLDLQSLLKSADTAMYDAKEAGRDNFRFYDPAIDTMTRDRLMLENDLRKALDRGEFELHYQPLIDHDQKKVVGAEALLRWRHPQRGMVPPAQFLPVAEEAGVIAQIGEWALRTACTDGRRWHDQGFDDLRLAVNVSARQFRRNNLLDVVNDALVDSGFPADRLELELTEGAVMRDVDRSIAMLGALKATGVLLSIDDFGTGYSSLSHLKRLPLDTLKVDGAFTRDMASNSDDAAITRAVIGVARTLRLEVVAEGIENQAQVDFLRAQGCRLMQGYLFGAPVKPDDFERRLHATGGGAQPVDNIVALRS